MNRYAQVLIASALAYTAQASAAAKWARGTTMSSPPQFIATVEQLVALTKEPRARQLVVCGNIANVPSIRLAPGQTLTGNGDNASISFVMGVDGLQLSSNNEVRNLRLGTAGGRRAIFSDTTVVRLGTIRLIRITTVGQVQLPALDTVPSGHVDVYRLPITSAPLRPHSTPHAALA